MKVTSMRGAVIDVARYMAQNEDAIAIGNAMMNARGDLIGPGGQVVKKREEIAAEYHRSNPKSVRKVALKELDSEVFASPAEAMTAVNEKVKELRENKEKAASADAAQQGSEQSTTKKRKISESDV